MTRRYLLFGVAALLLAALNLWQWSSRDAGLVRLRASAESDFRAEDFELKMRPADARPGGRGRDLFHVRLPVPPAIKKVEAVPPAPPPAKTPEELAQEAARAELAQIRFVGVVFRGHRREAFLVVRDQLYTVGPGGKIGDRFNVEAIHEDSIRVTDPATRVGGDIPISGK